jgi:hypothetical protein
MRLSKERQGSTDRIRIGSALTDILRFGRKVSVPVDSIE